MIYPVLVHQMMILSSGCLYENRENISIVADDDSGYTTNGLISSRGVSFHGNPLFDDPESRWNWEGTWWARRSFSFMAMSRVIGCSLGRIFGCLTSHEKGQKNYLPKTRNHPFFYERQKSLRRQTGLRGTIMLKPHHLFGITFQLTQSNGMIVYACWIALTPRNNPWRYFSDFNSEL